MKYIDNVVNIIRRLVPIIILTLILAFAHNEALAASANLSLSGGGTFNKGDTVTIAVKYTGSTFGATKGTINYDSDVLEYVSCSGAVANGLDGSVVYTMSQVGSSNLTCSVKFKAKNVGKTSIKVSTSELYNIDEEEMSVGNKSTTVTVKDKAAEASSNANLSALEASAGALSPAFSKNVTSYRVTCPYETTTCTLSANKADSKAKTSVTGSKDLKVGENVRKVVVTAENGNTKTYTVTIVRKDKENSTGQDGQSTTDKPKDDQTQKPPQEPNPVEKPSKIETVVKDNTYYVSEVIEETILPEGFVISSRKYNEYEIPVLESTDKSIVMGYLENTETAENELYFYSESKNSFYEKRYFTVDQLFGYGDSLKTAEEKETPKPENNEQASKSIKFFEDQNNIFIIFVFAATLGLLLLVVLILQISILRGRR